MVRRVFRAWQRLFAHVAFRGERRDVDDFHARRREDVVDAHLRLAGFERAAANFPRRELRFRSQHALVRRAKLQRLQVPHRGFIRSRVEVAREHDRNVVKRRVGRRLSARGRRKLAEPFQFAEKRRRLSRAARLSRLGLRRREVRGARDERFRGVHVLGKPRAGGDLGVGPTHAEPSHDTLSGVFVASAARVFARARRERKVAPHQLELRSSVEERDAVFESAVGVRATRAPLVFAVDPGVARGAHGGLDRIVVVIHLLQADDVGVCADQALEHELASVRPPHLLGGHAGEPRVGGHRGVGQALRQDVVLHDGEGGHGRRATDADAKRRGSGLPMGRVPSETHAASVPRDDARRRAMGKRRARRGA
mmetsp:Transcript_15780/g.66499  ORF Transcript_15780/g.66499 Transcript_15780/m.66499 type:complete len:366 (+) Transcript_15780:2200-3297(+)